MPATETPDKRNQLLEELPRRERARLYSISEPVELRFGDVLCDHDKPVVHAYFPLDGFIALVTQVSERPPLEVGLIGNEGVLGASLALNVPTAPMRGVVQGAGTALRINTGLMLHELRRSACLARVFHRYQYALLTQILQTAACTHFHEIEPRLARWLLMIQDCAHADHFHLTHEFLAGMLGVRRSGVTIAAGALQQRKIIRYSRGEITVLDRAALEATSCECYHAGKVRYERALN